MPWPLRMLLILWPLVGLLSFYTLRRFQHSVQVVLPNVAEKISRGVFVLWVWVMSYPLVMVVLYASGQYRQHYLMTQDYRWVDVAFTYPFFWTLIIAAIALPYLLIFHGFEKWGPLRTPKRRLWLHRLQLALLVVLVLWVPWKSYQDSHTIRLRTIPLELTNKGAVFQNLSILLIADVQADRFTTRQRLQALSTIADTTRYDLTLFAGDLITYSDQHLPEVQESICRFAQQAPAVACMGDHDYWFARQAVPQLLENCGWKFLQNRHHLVRWRDKLILVSGITNIYSNPMPEEQLERFLDMAPPAQLKILLVHQPSEWIAHIAEKYEYHLMVGGHTHGGQIVIPLLGWRFTPTMIENGFYSGRYQLGNLTVVVTNGIGFTFTPLRFGAPAEVTRIVINPEGE